VRIYLHCVCCTYTVMYTVRLRWSDFFFFLLQKNPSIDLLMRIVYNNIITLYYVRSTFGWRFGKEENRFNSIMDI